jgi:hypothetical protein
MLMVVNWQEVITTLGATVGAGGVLLAASAWLMKTVLTDKFAREAEAFKSRLKAEADIEIERLKSSLQMTAIEHQVRFSKLHERRAELIAELTSAWWMFSGTDNVSCLPAQVRPSRACGMNTIK